MLNSEIETIFSGFTVDQVAIPVNFLFYDGDAESWIVYSNVDNYHSLSGDDELLGYVTYYDFEIYSKGNFMNILRAAKSLLISNGWTFQPSRSSQESYDRDTRVYSKTICFAKPIQTNL
jgi:hypothetical protein